MKGNRKKYIFFYLLFFVFQTVKNRIVTMEPNKVKNFDRQLVRKGISQGWTIVNVDGKPFTLELLESYKKGDHQYEMEMKFIIVTRS